VHIFYSSARVSTKPGVGNLLKLAERMAQEGGGRSGEIPLGKDAKAVYGFSVRWLGEGRRLPRPVFKRFGNIREIDGKLKIEKNREPLVDVFEDKGEITVVAEMPGVEEKDIEVKLEEKKLIISTKEEAKTKYFREVELPAKASLEKKNYKNGVLEIKLKKEEKVV
jgi:HSP20 family protein